MMYDEYKQVTPKRELKLNKIKATNIKWHQSKVTLKDIEERNVHQGCVVWLTGLSASGKSTIAVECEKILFDHGYNVFILDGDNVRHGLNKNLGFSPEDREENIRRVGEVCKLFRSAGFIVFSSFISPYTKDRNIARELIDDGHFFEVYVKCDVEECAKRDPKGLYQKAKEGIVKEFTGVSAPYEEPENPELIIDTALLNIEDSVWMVVEKLMETGIISK
jgi:adenylyl-sulfate kinase